MRKLTINRKKTFVASLAKIIIYIESNDLSVSDKVLSVNKKHFRFVGAITNGKTLTVDIPNERVEILVVFSVIRPMQFNTSYDIPSGVDDIFLYTKPVFSLSRGNPFTIEQVKL